jgi:hypothetical protein
MEPVPETYLLNHLTRLMAREDYIKLLGVGSVLHLVP